MTLDSLVASLGSDARNLGAHSLILVQQQQQAAPVAAGQAQTGCGGAQALLQCCYNRLCQSTPRRTRGIIVLSMDHSARVWTNQQHGLNASAATPRLILDAVTLRFPLPPTAANASAVAAAAPAASEPISLSSHPRTSVQQLLPHEISLASMRRIIEKAAQRFTEEYENEDKLAAATPADAAAAVAVSSTAAAAAAAADLFSLDGAADSHATSPSCSSVTVLLDDVVSLMVRFGSLPTLSFLQSLKSSVSASINLIVGCDMDGVATLPPAAAAAQVSLHAHLSHLATTTVSLRTLRPLDSSGSVFQARVHVLHKRTSGRISNVAEEVEIDVRAGAVRKAARDAAATAAATADAAAAADSSSAAAAAAASPAASLASQFGSSFSLDLSSKARSARAAAVLPYQHTGQAQGWNDSVAPAGAGGGIGSSLDGPEEAEELLLSDDDQDFDDPDDDLEV